MITPVAMLLLSCLALGVLATTLWFGRGPRGRLAIRDSFRARVMWRAWLWGERAWVKADDRSHRAQVRRVTTMSDASFVEALCERLGSVWVGGSYSRRWVRRVLYGIRLAPHTFASWFWYVICDRVLVAYTQHPGRFDLLGPADSHLIAEALSVSEPDDSEGPYAIFAGPFPWGKDAAIVTHLDEVGFFTYATYPTLDLAREQFLMARERVLSPFGEDTLTCDVCGEFECAADLTPDWDGEQGAHRSCLRNLRLRGYTLG